MTNISLDVLPESVRDLVELVGITAAMAIVNERGGIRLYVPVEATQDHWLAESIGMDAFTILVKRYAGDEIEIPRCISALTVARREMIAGDASKGMAITEMARKYNYTERGIRKALRGYAETLQSDADQFELEL